MRTWIQMLAMGAAFILFLFGIKEIRISPNRRKSFFIMTLMLAVALLNIKSTALCQEELTAEEADEQQAEEEQAGEEQALDDEAAPPLDESLFQTREWQAFKAFWKKLDAQSVKTLAKKDAFRQEEEKRQEKAREKAKREKNVFEKAWDGLLAKMPKKFMRISSKFDERREYGGAMSNAREKELLDELETVVEGLKQYQTSGLLNERDIFVLRSLCERRIRDLASSYEKTKAEMASCVDCRYSIGRFLDPIGDSVLRLERKVSVLNDLKRSDVVRDEDVEQAYAAIAVEVKALLVKFWEDSLERGESIEQMMSKERTEKQSQYNDSCLEDRQESEDSWCQRQFKRIKELALEIEESQKKKDRMKSLADHSVSLAEHLWR